MVSLGGKRHFFLFRADIVDMKTNTNVSYSVTFQRLGAALDQTLKFLRKLSFRSIRVGCCFNDWFVVLQHYVVEFCIN